MKTIKKIILKILGIALTLCMLAIPIAVWIEKNSPELIKMKTFFCYDFLAIISISAIGTLLTEHKKTKQNEDKNR